MTRKKTKIEVYPTLIFQYEFPGPAARKKSYMYLFTNLVTHKTLMLLLSCKREGKKDSAKLI